VRFIEAGAAFGILIISSAPAEAQTINLNIPAGRLSDAIIAFGEQTGLVIGTTDPGVAMVRSRGVRGRMTPREGLTRLLDGTGFGFSFAGPQAVRIARLHPVRLSPRTTPPVSQVRRIAPPPLPETEIVVTASKQRALLQTFPGTVHLVQVGAADVGRFGARGSEAVLTRLPVLASTSLGPGRNKIFVRGVADSSFNGPSQSVVGQYLGDVRLTFNAPDPDLQLYDIQRVEVLEGPQGTLYGSGALGGIIRLVPNEPDAAGVAGRLSAGLAATNHGQPSWDGSAMVNLPLISGRLALRAVGYGAIEGGYVDDLERRRRDVNRTTSYGVRAALLWTPGNDWQLELNGTAQFIAGRDGQYAERGQPSLSRRSALAQPFDNDYRLGALVLRKRWSSVELMSATSVVRHDLETRFDATGFPGSSGPQLFVEDIGITLIANETRISRPEAYGSGWVLGWSVLDNISRLTRRIGPPTAPAPITGVRNDIFEGAIFGQYSFSLTGRLTATLGGRLTYSRSTGQPLDTPEDANEPSRSEFRPSPTAALSWRPANNVLLYARYQRGFRAGGLAVAATGSGMSAQRFETDSLSSLEAGIRVGRPEAGPVSVNAAISYSRWADIQADLVDSRGLPFTTNLGDGRIYGFEVEASWRATPRLSFETSVFLNDSALSYPAPAFAAADERDLPNVAAAGGRLAAHYRVALGPRLNLSVDAAARYVGPSRLGIGAPLDARQGEYVEGQIGVRVELGRLGLTLDLDNVGDTRGNRFAFGNPFGIVSQNQVTPVRPRTVRLGVDAAF